MVGSLLEADPNQSRVTAWIVARSGQGAAWFSTLFAVLEEWTGERDGLIPGGYYAAPVVQTASGLLALDEGIRAGQRFA